MQEYLMIDMENEDIAQIVYRAMGSNGRANVKTLQQMMIKRFGFNAAGKAQLDPDKLVLGSKPRHFCCYPIENDGMISGQSYYLKE